jgi:hypothetical protein
MTRTLTFEIPEELYRTFEQMAAKYGKSTEQVALEYLAQHAPKPRPKLSEEELREARQRFLRHAGAASLGYPTGADNESIDADLAREYGSTHEEQS